MRERRSGFTLIELLVVIAIIAILAAILFPVFVRARESATQAVCLAHASELGKAVIMYRDDQNDRLPLHIGWEGTQSGSTKDRFETYYMLLARYTKTKTGSFRCPMTYPKAVSVQPFPDNNQCKPGKYMCYACGLSELIGRFGSTAPDKMFGYHWHDPATATSYAAFLYPPNQKAPNITQNEWYCFPVSAEIFRLTKLPYLFEAKYDFIQGWNQATARAEDSINANGSGGDGYVTPRHGDWNRLCVVFYDGHAQMMLWNDFKVLAKDITDNPGHYVNSPTKWVTH